jgi:hypothetical protein
MLRFEKSSISSELVVTLTELSTLIEPFYYLFVFTHTETRTQIKKILATADDESNYKYRYNKWTVVTEDFLKTTDEEIAKDGHYTYEVYEQESESDTTTNNKTIVEYGRAIVIPEVEFGYEDYDTQTSYKSYNG